MNASGIIFCDIYNDTLSVLSDRKSVSLIPFCGKYKLLDFSLTPFCHNGFNTTYLLCAKNKASIEDYYEETDRFEMLPNKLKILNPFINEQTKKPSYNIWDMLLRIKEILEKDTSDYFVINENKCIISADIKKLFILCNENKYDGIFLFIRSICGEYFTGISVLSKNALLSTLEQCIAKGTTDIKKEIKPFFDNTFKIQKVITNNVYHDFNSVTEYFRKNMILCRSDIQRRNLYGLTSKKIYCRDPVLPPSMIRSEADIKDSIISDGCIIEGSIKNCVLSENVSISRRSVLKNCIIFDDVKVCDGVYVENAIIKSGKKISEGIYTGTEEKPLII